jgi:hypothetical protein
MTDYKNYQAPRTLDADTIIIGLLIIGFIAILGWMGERDREHQIEVSRLAAMAHECAPTIELIMPIEPGRML